MEKLRKWDTFFIFVVDFILFCFIVRYRKWDKFLIFVVRFLLICFIVRYKEALLKDNKGKEVPIKGNQPIGNCIDMIKARLFIYI